MTPSMVNYRLHYELTKYRVELSAERKQAVHLLALTMGEDDPLKPDYSKFIGIIILIIILKLINKLIIIIISST